MMVLYFVAYHALSTPRSAQIPLTRSLGQTGIAFFLILLILRLVNMSIAIYGRPSLVFLTVLCVLSRSLDHSHSGPYAL